MEKRKLGRTGLEVSVLGYGAGAVGGLMVRGAAADQERAIARAIELGINYFDTAALYGNGESEKNLGRVLRSLKPDVYLGTKVRLLPEEYGRIGEAVTQSLENSLKRLGRDSVDLFQFHNAIGAGSRGDAVGLEQVMQEVVPAFEKLRQQGKTRFIGITAVGDVDALHEVLTAKVFETAQIPYNLLHPSAGNGQPAGYPAQDYKQLMVRAQETDTGVIGIRVVAGGALSGSEERHSIASPPPPTIGSGSDYRSDVARARRLMPLVEEGHAGSLIEASMRYVIAHSALSTVLIGTSTLDELEIAAAAIAKGPLSAAALARAAELQQGFVGEQR